MSTFNELVIAFNNMVQQNNFLEALAEFYAEEVISIDNFNEPNNGIDALRNEVLHFIENATIESVQLVSLMIEDNLSVSNWHYKFNHKKFGKVDTNQISVQRWKDNKIIQEHHFYNA